MDPANVCEAWARTYEQWPWVYNQHFAPSFTIGLTLRHLQIARNLSEEIEMAESGNWKIWSRVEEESKYIQPNDIELKTIEDGRKYTRPDCTLVIKKMMEKPKVFSIQL